MKKVRIKKRGPGGTPGNGQSALSLASLQQLRTRGDLSTLTRRVRTLGRSRDIAVETRAQAFLLVCDLASEKGRLPDVMEFGLKTLRLDAAPASTRIPAARYIGLTMDSLARINPRDQARIRQQLSSFTGKHLRVPDLERMGAEEQVLWFYTLHSVFPTTFLGEQLFLAETIFSQGPEYKVDAATIFLVTARRLVRSQAAQIPQESARAKAEYVLDTIPEIMRDRSKWTDEVFHTFMIDIGCFELWDLQERAMAIREPAAEDPIWAYHRLMQKLQEGTEAAYAEMLESFPLPGNHNTTITAELAILQARILRDYLELKKKDVAGADLQAKTLFERVLLEPNQDHPDIVRTIKRLRTRAFQALAECVARRAYACFNATFPGLVGLENGIGYLVCVPQANAIETYLLDPRDHAFFKVAYPTTQHSRRGHIPTANATFAGSVPLLWEYLPLITTLRTGIVEESAPQHQALNELDAAIKRAGNGIFLRDNLAAFAVLNHEFSTIEGYQTLLVELANRRRLCEEIFQRFVPAVEAKSYALDPLDFLYPIVSEIEIIDATELRRILSDSLYFSRAEIETQFARPSTKLPMGVIIKTRSGKEVFGVMKDPQNIQILGTDNRAGSLLKQFLATAALEAVVKLFASYTEKRGARADARTGYVLAPDGNLNPAAGTAGRALDILAGIFRGEFYQQLGREGLITFPWYYYERIGRTEGLYHPLEDQSPEGKRRTLEERGAGELYVQTEPSGTASRLPVRLKRIDGKLVPAPFDRNPLREEQQTLLGDTQPLPTYYGLYIITTLSDSSHHIYLYALRNTEEEVLTAELLDEVTTKVQGGVFRDPQHLLQHTNRTRRGELERQLRSGEIQITDQVTEVFELATTFRRPHLNTVAQLLADGVPLEV